MHSRRRGGASAPQNLTPCPRACSPNPATPSIFGLPFLAYLFVFFLYRGPSHLVGDLLERFIAAPLGRVLVFTPGVVESLAIDVLGMARKRVLDAVGKLLIGPIGHAPLVPLRPGGHQNVCAAARAPQPR